MNKDNQDLPVEYIGDRDLPIPIPGTAPVHEVIQNTAHPGWKSYSSQTHIWDIGLDTEGSLWLATGGGILHWHPDLKRYSRYGSEHGLPGNPVLKISASDPNQIWAAPQMPGLFYLDENTWRAYPFLHQEKINCTHQDKNSRLWVGTSRGIFAIEAANEEPVLTLPLPAGEPRVMATNNLDVWIAGAWGLFQYKDNNWKRITPYPGIIDMLIVDHFLWLGTANGLECLDLDSGDKKRNQEWPSGEVTALSLDKNGVWTAGAGNFGIATIEGWQMINSIGDTGRINGIATGNDGSAWIGASQGLLRCKKEKVEYYSTDTAPDAFGFAIPGRSTPSMSNLIQTLAVQSDEERPMLWIGAARGLYSLDIGKEEWKRYHQIADVRGVSQSHQNGEIFIASWMEGIYRVRDHGSPEKINETMIVATALESGRNNDLWIGGMDGLWNWNGQNWTQALGADQLPGNAWIRTIAQNHENFVWVGTSAGNFRYNSQNRELQRIGSELGTANVQVVLILEDQGAEHIFIGTNNGLYTLKETESIPLTDLEGKSVTALAWDSISRILWVGAEDGLYHLTLMDTKWSMQQGFNVHNSGLSYDQVNALAIYRINENKVMLWIGTPNGFSCFEYENEV